MRQGQAGYNLDASASTPRPAERPNSLVGRWSDVIDVVVGIGRVGHVLKQAGELRLVVSAPRARGRRSGRWVACRRTTTRTARCDRSDGLAFTAMASFRVFFRGDLGDARQASKRDGTSVYGGFVDLTASIERDAQAKFSAAMRGVGRQGNCHQEGVVARRPVCSVSQGAWMRDLVIDDVTLTRALPRVEATRRPPSASRGTGRSSDAPRYERGVRVDADRPARPPRSSLHRMTLRGPHPTMGAALLRLALVRVASAVLPAVLPAHARVVGEVATEHGPAHALYKGSRCQRPAAENARCAATCGWGPRRGTARGWRRC